MLRLYETPSYELGWKPEKGTICLLTPGRSIEGVPGVEFTHRGKLRQISGSELESGRITQETVHDTHGQGQNIHIYYMATGGLAISLRIRLYQMRPFVLLRVFVTNVGPETVAIRRFFVRSIPGGVRGTAAPRGFFTNGWHSSSPAGYLDSDMEPYSSERLHQTGETPTFTANRDLRFGRKDIYISEMVGAVITPNEALIGGCVSTADQFVQFLADLSNGFSLFELQSQADDTPLDVGASLSSEWLYLEWVPLPNEDPFAQYALAVVRQMNLDRVRDVSLGWRSRESHQQTLTESAIFENLASAALFSHELPVKRIEICKDSQTETGDWGLRDEIRFPHDYGWIARRIQGSGFASEISVSPLLVHPRSELAREHPEWLLRNQRNTPLTIHVANGTFKCLDVTHPEAYKYLANIIEDVVHHGGFEGIHLKDMYIGAIKGRRYNQRLTRAQALRRAFQCIRETTGSDISITVSDSPFGPPVGIVDRMQVSYTGTGFWEPADKNTRTKKHSTRATPCLRNTLLNTINRSWMNKRLWINDVGPMLLDKENVDLEIEELLLQFTIIGMSGSAAIISDDLTEITPENQSQLAALFPPLVDGMDAVDLFDSPMPELAVVKVARSWGRWQLVALINWTDDYVERDLPSSLHLDTHNEYHLVDFWEQRYFRIKSDSAWPVLHIDPHSVVLLSLRPIIVDSAHLVATTFHITQGGEISDFAADEGNLAFHIDLGRTAKGSVWLALPAKPVQVKVNGHSLDLSNVRTVATGVYAVTFLLRESAQLWVSWNEENTEVDLG